jgi:TPP-dependent pyruvate/acetoin dehydrogenase alpha subunit
MDTYRPPEEVVKWKDQCPIAALEKKLAEDGVTEGELREIQESVIAKITAAVEFGRRQKNPTPESAMDDVYA